MITRQKAFSNVALENGCITANASKTLFSFISNAIDCIGKNEAERDIGKALWSAQKIAESPDYRSKWLSISSVDPFTSKLSVSLEFAPRFVEILLGTLDNAAAQAMGYAFRQNLERLNGETRPVVHLHHNLSNSNKTVGTINQSNKFSERNYHLLGGNKPCGTISLEVNRQFVEDVARDLQDPYLKQTFTSWADYLNEDKEADDIDQDLADELDDSSDRLIELQETAVA